MRRECCERETTLDEILIPENWDLTTAYRGKKITMPRDAAHYSDSMEQGLYGGDFSG